MQKSRLPCQQQTAVALEYLGIFLHGKAQMLALQNTFIIVGVVTLGEQLHNPARLIPPIPIP